MTSPPSVEIHALVYLQIDSRLRIPDPVKSDFKLESRFWDPENPQLKPLVLVSFEINNVRHGGVLVRKLTRDASQARWGLKLSGGALRKALNACSDNLYLKTEKVPPSYSQRLPSEVMRVPCIPEGACRPNFSAATRITGLTLSQVAFKAHFLS